MLAEGACQLVGIALARVRGLPDLDEGGGRRCDLGIDVVGQGIEKRLAGMRLPVRWSVTLPRCKAIVLTLRAYPSETLF